jgi:hypothetical protein
VKKKERAKGEREADYSDGLFWNTGRTLRKRG